MLSNGWYVHRNANENIFLTTFKASPIRAGCVKLMTYERTQGNWYPLAFCDGLLVLSVLWRRGGPWNMFLCKRQHTRAAVHFARRVLCHIASTNCENIDSHISNHCVMLKWHYIFDCHCLFCLFFFFGEVKCQQNILLIQQY